MLNLLKPGHILRFGTCPGGINSPAANNPENNNNALEILWPTISNLGAVQAISHPDGAIGPIAARAATRLRDGWRVSRAASYSAIGRARTPANRQVGAQNCDFVGYTDGKAHYVNSANTVFSKDFSGCTMVVYTQGGVRRVAHAAASRVPMMNCKQAFMNTIQANGAVLQGWFKPYPMANDLPRKLATYQLFAADMNNNINNLTTFGVITAGNVPYTVDAFKPAGAGMGANDWVVTHVQQATLNLAWVVP